MKINYYAKNYEIGDEVKQYIEERIEKLSKYANNQESINANIRVEKTKHQKDEDVFSMTVELEIDKNGYFVEKFDSTVFQAFDECEEAIDEMIRREKDKIESSKKKNESIKNID